MLSVESMNLSNSPSQPITHQHLPMSTPSLQSQQQPPQQQNNSENGDALSYVTSTPLPTDIPEESQKDEEKSSSEQAALDEKNAAISSLFEEIRLEAALFPLTPASTHPNGKKLMKRKSELTLEMTSIDDVEEVLGDSLNTSFNPKHPFGPSPSGNTNGFGEVNSPSSSYRNSEAKSSPPLSKYAQNNQGQRNSPQPYPQMSPYTAILPNLQSSPPTAAAMAMHSPAGNLHSSPLAMPSPQQMLANGHHPLHIPHHTRLLQHQQSAPNLRQGVFDDQPPRQPNSLASSSAGRPFDVTLVEEFGIAVRAIMMASSRIQCRNVYRQLTAEVSELYSRVVKNQVPKKAVKKIVASNLACTVNECYELERQFKCLSDGLESRRSSQLYESIVHFLFKMRIAIPDASPP